MSSRTLTFIESLSNPSTGMWEILGNTSSRFLQAFMALKSRSFKERGLPFGSLRR